ncbi:energy transducer TonB [Hymenobacter canadensis]|uniref:Energy transducer TonB n=1 Tax=Hymenobacter canadensis TaxID=2999067 RepID=A0ABY7LPE0_9BACT|nr:energy transducer TonB [Hymenobacter canadensis]WBA42289.1 energy transducer TonB [Hymenobacter canadensis]
MLRLATLVLLLLMPRLLAAQTANSTALTDSDSSLAGPATSAAAPASPVVPVAPVAPVLYHAADEMPAFPGGASAFQQFLRQKLRYPDEALRRNLSGKVHISFVVDEQGHIIDPKVVRGLGGGLDEEALRLVRIMPWWTPGRVAGQPVRVAYTLPIVFRALE